MAKKKPTTKKNEPANKSKGTKLKKITKEELKKIKGGVTPQQLWPWADY